MTQTIEQLQAHIERLNYSLAQETALSDRLKTASRMPGTGNYVEWIETIRNSHDQVEQLQARVAELEAENARLKAMEESALNVLGQLDEVVIALPYDYLDPPDGGDVSLGEQVTRMYSEVKTLRHAVVIAQAEIKRLRDALEPVARALITLKDSFAERGARPTAPAMRELWDLAWSAYEKLVDAANSPTDTSALDSFVAEKVKEYQKHNGILGREVKDLTRQRDLAVKVLEKACEIIEDEWGMDEWGIGREALSTIKERETALSTPQ